MIQFVPEDYVCPSSIKKIKSRMVYEDQDALIQVLIPCGDVMNWVTIAKIDGELGTITSVGLRAVNIKWVRSTGFSIVDFDGEDCVQIHY